jgi:hypothetical protein
VQLLRKHFGLEAYFATTRIAAVEGKAWPDHPHHNYHWPDEELHTTTCYVTLPRQATTPLTYPLSEMEAECGYARVKAAQSALVQLPDPQTQEKRAKQFRHLMQTLKIQPYTHESQLTVKVSADVKKSSEEKETGA